MRNRAFAATSAGRSGCPPRATPAARETPLRGSPSTRHRPPAAGAPAARSVARSSATHLPPHRVVDGLDNDAAIPDEEGVRAVFHAGPVAPGRPLQKGHVAVHQPGPVLVTGARQFLAQEPGGAAQSGLPSE